MEEIGVDFVQLPAECVVNCSEAQESLPSVTLLPLFHVFTDYGVAMRDGMIWLSYLGTSR